MSLAVFTRFEVSGYFEKGAFVLLMGLLHEDGTPVAGRHADFSDEGVALSVAVIGTDAVADGDYAVISHPYCNLLLPDDNAWPCIVALVARDENGNTIGEAGVPFVLEPVRQLPQGQYTTACSCGGEYHACNQCQEVFCVKCCAGWFSVSCPSCDVDDHRPVKRSALLEHQDLPPMEAFFTTFHPNE